MKNKALRPVIISVAVLAVLAGAYVWLLDSEAPEPSPSPSPTAEAQTVVLTQIPLTELDHVVFAPKEGLSYTIAVKPGAAEETFSYSLTPAQAGFPYQESRLSLAANRFDGLSAAPLALPDGQNLADFGLENPRMTVTVVSKTGGTVVLRIGDNNATQSGAFVMKEGDSGLYLLGYTDVNNLTKDETYFRDLSYLPPYPVTETETLPSFIASIRLEGKYEPFTVRQRTPDDPSDGVMPSQYVMTEPVSYETSDYYVVDTMIAAIAAISPSQVVEDFPQDLAPYGLADPYRLTVTDTQGRTLILLMGDTAPEGGRYVMLDGCDAVLLDTAGTYDFLNFQYTGIMSKLLWLYNIETLDSVTMHLPGGSVRVLSFEHATDEDGNDVREAALDGVSITEKNGARLYTAVLSFSITGAYTDTVSVPPDATISIRLLDGAEHRMELYPVNERTYAVSLDGQPAAYTVSVNNLNELIKKLQIVDEGGDL